MVGEFERQVVQLDDRLGDAEKHAKALLGRIRALRKRNATGDLSPLPSLFEQIPGQAAQVVAAAQAAHECLVYDTTTSLSDGSYLTELKEEARRQGVAMIERDGRLSAFPLLLKLEAKAAGIRIGRAMERRLRPSTFVRLLGKAQTTTRFDAARFVNQLFNAYAYLAPVAQPGWQAKASVGGPAVLLDEIYGLLTLHPAATAEYSRDAFACDLLRLDRAPETRTSAGHGFTLPASTGSKGRNRLTVFDEEGIERMFVSLRFTLEAGRQHDRHV